MLKRVILKILIVYKKYISKGGHCRFVPSCSEYAYEAIDKHGIVKGWWMGIKRILKCHPWGKSGIDLVK